MTECRRRICTEETDGEPFCSDRCERLYSPSRKPNPFDEAAAHREQYNRARVINNDRGQR